LGKGPGFSPNANQLRAPFIDLKPLNGNLLHAIIEFSSIGFVGMAFGLLVMGISSAITTRSGAASSLIGPKFTANGPSTYP